MTIVFASISQSSIAISVDSAVANYFENGTEYTTEKKSVAFKGLGCVATWGERTGNRIFQFLDQLDAENQEMSIEDLAKLVKEYLQNSYRPHEDARGDIGIYVTGFDHSGSPRLFQNLWAREARNSEESSEYIYHFYDSSPVPKTLRFYYDGRFNLAQSVFEVIIDELNGGTEIPFDLSSEVGRVMLHDFVLRFSSEITQDVGPPFITYLVNPSNEIKRIRSDGQAAISEEEITSTRYM